MSALVTCDPQQPELQILQDEALTPKLQKPSSTSYVCTKLSLVGSV